MLNAKKREDCSFQGLFRKIQEWRLEFIKHLENGVLFPFSLEAEESFQAWSTEMFSGAFSFCLCCLEIGQQFMQDPSVEDCWESATILLMLHGFHVRQIYETGTYRADPVLSSIKRLNIFDKDWSVCTYDGLPPKIISCLKKWCPKRKATAFYLGWENLATVLYAYSIKFEEASDITLKHFPGFICTVAENLANSHEKKNNLPAALFGFLLENFVLEKLGLIDKKNLKKLNSITLSQDISWQEHVKKELNLPDNIGEILKKEYKNNREVETNLKIIINRLKIGIFSKI